MYRKATDNTDHFAHIYLPQTVYNTLALDSLTYLLGVSSILVASRSLYFTSYYMADSAKEKRKKRKEKAATTEKPPAQQPADGDGKPANVDGESEITPPSTSHRSKSRPTSPRSKNARRRKDVSSVASSNSRSRQVRTLLHFSITKKIRFNSSWTESWPNSKRSSRRSIRRS